jgi:hypothetical protein
MLENKKASSSLPDDFIHKTAALYSLNQDVLQGKYIPFIDYFASLSKVEKEYTQYHFVSKFCYTAPLINALYDSTKAIHLPSTWSSNLEWINGCETEIFELIRQETDLEVRIFWVRLYLLRPYTRKAHAEHLLLCSMLADDSVAQTLITSCQKQEGMFLPTRWQKFWGKY